MWDAFVYEVSHLKVIGVGGAGGRGAGGWGGNSLRTGPCCHCNSEMSIIPSVRLEASSSKCTGPAAAGSASAAAAYPLRARRRGGVAAADAAGCTALSSGRAPQGGGPEITFLNNFFLLARTSRKQPSELFGARPEILSALEAVDRILTCCLTTCRTSAD